jgi:monoamine oxidase
MFDSTSRYKLKRGTGDLVRRILGDAVTGGRARVRLWSPVRRVEQRSDGVVVTLESGETVEAARAVVTLPLNVLHSVEFDPPLSPLRAAAAQERQATTGFQLMIQVRPVAANDDPTAADATEGVEDFVAISDTQTGIQWLSTEWRTDAAGRRKPPSEPRAAGDGAVMVSYGPDARAFDIHDREAVQREVRRLMGPGVEVVETFGWDWCNDRFAQGTWTILRPGQLTRLHAALQEPEPPVGGGAASARRLFFAGDYMAGGWNGFIDGAIESGLRTARRVVDAAGRSDGSERDAVAARARLRGEA